MSKQEAHHIWPDRDMPALQQEEADVLALLAQLPLCPDCGRDYSHPRRDGFTLYRVPCGCKIGTMQLYPMTNKQ